MLWLHFPYCCSTQLFNQNLTQQGRSKGKAFADGAVQALVKGGQERWLMTLNQEERAALDKTIIAWSISRVLMPHRAFPFGEVVRLLTH